MVGKCLIHRTSPDPRLEEAGTSGRRGPCSASGHSIGPERGLGWHRLEPVMNQFTLCPSHAFGVSRTGPPLSRVLPRPRLPAVPRLRKFICKGAAGLQGRLHSFAGTVLLESCQPKVKAVGQDIPARVAFPRPQLEGRERGRHLVPCLLVATAQAGTSCPGRWVC